MDVSVVIPCFNQGRYLGDALYSLSCQSDLDIEVVVVNDGSDDISYTSFMQNQRAKYPNLDLRLVEQKNQGLSAARNTGIDASIGRYVLFMDADDMVIRDIILRHVENLRGSEKGVSLCNYLLCNEDRSKFWPPSNDTISPYAFDFSSIANCWERGYSIPIHCALFDRAIIDDVRFSSKLAAKEDWLFWLSVTNLGAQAKYMHIDGAIYRQHASAMTKDLRKMGIQWLRALKEAEAMFPNRFSDHLLSSGVMHFRQFYLRHFWAVSGCDFPAHFYSELFRPEKG